MSKDGLKWPKKKADTKWNSEFFQYERAVQFEDRVVIYNNLFDRPCSQIDEEIEDDDSSLSERSSKRGEDSEMTYVHAIDNVKQVYNKMNDQPS